MSLRRLAGIVLVVALATAGCASRTEWSSSSPPTLHDEVPAEWTTQDTGVAAVPSTDSVAGTMTPAGAVPRPASLPFGTALAPTTGVAPITEKPDPVAIRLPSLGVEGAAVVPVGVEEEGAMEIPAADQVGWYRFGPGPGRPGSAVLAAHIAADGVDGVFRHLDRLEAGDVIEVVDATGTTRTFEIVGLGEFAKDQLPFDELFSRTGPERLVLITCGGDFNPDLRSYDNNVVAFAVPAGT